MTGIQTLKSLGNTSVGCPLTTKSLELSFLRLLSRSSRASKRNLHRHKREHKLPCGVFPVCSDQHLWFVSMKSGPRKEQR